MKPKSWKFWERMTKQIIKDPSLYFPEYFRYDKFPRMTGIPLIEVEDYRIYSKRSKFSSNRIIGLRMSPKDCYLHRIINYPYRRLGSPQIAIRGNKGTYKSNNLTLLTGLFAAKGVRMICFSDDAFEFRHLAAHGYFDKENKFNPFKLEIWIPKDYKFDETAKAHNPIWNYRNNVELREYKNINQIMDTLAPHKLTIIYEQCFTPKAKLKLLNDVYLYQARNFSPNKVSMIVHHELQSLLPENPSSDLYNLAFEIAKRFGRSRKDRVGLLSSFHMTNEVFYKISSKFRFLIEKQPTNIKYLSKAEKDVQKQSRQTANITEGGYWTTHELGYFPELPDMFRLIPSKKLLQYPSLKPKEKKKTDKVELDKLKYEALVLRAKGESYNSISDKLGVPQQTIWSWIKKLGAVK